MGNYLVVAIGGALGAMARYGLGIWITSKWAYAFPLHTFVINICGAFLLGLVNTLPFEHITSGPLLKLAVGVGFLGAFTTFSTFSYEILTLLKGGSIATSMLYLAASVFIALLGVLAGSGLARLF